MWSIFTAILHHGAGLLVCFWSALLTHFAWRQALRPCLLDRLNETRVHRALFRLRLPALHDVYLQDARDVTRIDHLVRTQWGIAVLETRHHDDGFLHGARQDPEWTHQTGLLPPSPIANPFIQNRRHVQAVRDVTEIRNDAVEGFVVFAGMARLSASVRDCAVPLSGLAGALCPPDRPPYRSDVELERCWRHLRAVAEAGRAGHRKRGRTGWPRSRVPGRPWADRLGWTAALVGPVAFGWGVYILCR